MATFEVHGPFRVPYVNKKGGRTLDFDEFWSENSSASYLAEKCGCYVFAIQTGGGSTPIYVGKATRSFRQETFNPANRHKYHNGFAEYARGAPVMYFVVHPTQKGKNNISQISEIEDFLIQAGAAKNPNMQNMRGRQQPEWGIKGVIRGGKGQRSSGEVKFGKLFAIHK